MADEPARLEIRAVSSIDQIGAADWDRCAGLSNPFIRHAFLKALEDSDCVGREAGWLPHHLVVTQTGNPPGGSGVVGCAPLYLKGHSYGEYVFDHGWAAAFERAGGSYYPKLQSAVPFTPVTGPRLLVAPDTPDRETIIDAMIDGMASLCRRNGLSSAHVTFPTEHEWERFGRRDWLQRVGQQYHWFNDGYDSFDDFLATLTSRRRKQIRRERREVADAGVRMHAVTGDDLRPEHWDAFYRFYEDTGSRKWGIPYLNREFFGLLGETMADSVVLVLADYNGRTIAGALNLRGNDTLFGRNWGCDTHIPFLHFEACYYQAMDFAIDNGLTKVEAGAQGEHKIQRGYLPVRTFSAHYISHQGLRRAVANFVEQEAVHIAEDMEDLAGFAPFKRTPPGRSE
ncbi:GNAT family N-acetyltransferase [Fodinicurvata sp. EGI_FJ10296]|uniref:GNAT family N-acetyltransferase n=1 Tax=Fodinicurvata sp. EGI_FJ10296 TaxID=3231908 RepID=UPI003452DC59